MENKKPKIRVAGFNDEWNQLELGEISDIKTGPFGSTLHAKDYIEDGMPIITTEHFKSGQLPENKSNTPQVSDEDYLRLKSYKLQKGDIVFSRVGSIDINALVTDVQDGWLFSGRVLRVRPNKQFDSGYLHYLLETTPVRNDVVARAVGQTMPSINTEILKKTKITTSKNVDEQNKIFSILKNIDSIASLHQQELDTLKQTKKGFLQKMFPKEGQLIPELRYPGFDTKWELRSLGEVAPLRGGFAFQSKKFKKNGVPIVRISNIKSNGEVGGDYAYYDAQSKDEKFLLKDGAALLAMSGATTGKVAILKNSDNGKVYQNQRVGLFTITDKVNYDFISIIVRSPMFTNQLKSVLVSGAQPNVSSREIDSFEFLFPKTKEEQIQIGKFFKQLDELIALQQQEIDALKQTKKAFLQKMFV
ncbi:restriction endonuclease subunit S [Planococcus citreus]|uniref:Type I restriction enzyme S subunit n=1 Tax=Planococcus citreus TaxID=1373 RepID=A0A497YBN3_9BACL|nr:restriction endonuclease subunit S [Planococcus citreus]RLJ81344.1 type I restriction enzyme S subunit [Planococcus citreus]